MNIVKDTKDLEKEIGYEFIDKQILKTALTHSSYANEMRSKKAKSNERLEFLGDAVLQLIISHYIFESFPELPEGELTKLRASIVCEQTLAKISQKNDFGSYLMLGKGEEATGGRCRDSILADLFEAILGAIYLDGKMEVARKFVIDLLEDEIQNMLSEFKISDSKTYLQELIQKDSKEPLEYVIISEEGPEHDKLFVAEVCHMGKALGKGSGKTKKEAEQNAAAAAIKDGCLL